MAALPTFAELMAIEALPDQPDTFISKVPAWPPRGGGASYGGHVYAQSAWAASQTVPAKVILHSISGYFTFPGQTDRAYVYEVSQTSQGSSFCARTVTVRQVLDPKISGHLSPPPAEGTRFTVDQVIGKKLGPVCFVCICSFKRDEPLGPMQHQPWEKPWEKYEVLQGKLPMDHIESPNIDLPWYVNLREAIWQETSFPGLTTRTPDMEAWNADKEVHEKRQLSLYRLLGSLPEDQPNLHACAHLYSSDRNSLFPICNWQGCGDLNLRVGSLSHHVVFHVGSRGVLMQGVRGSPAEDAVPFPQGGAPADASMWFLQESSTPRSEANRGLVESRIWDAHGVLIAHTMQDGMVRPEYGRGAIALRAFEKSTQPAKEKL